MNQYVQIGEIKVKVPDEEPVAPDSSDCCGSGSCCPCVWDYYRAQQQAWQQAQAGQAD
ncbi:oxidoreductase-like domain-containing protein [Rheinheimera sp.]|uniref:oxidoreductase-like domain-containing protein n=1 Tax=Rheinheimera sp. TaxID=1869214 RepID=UPI00307CF714